MITEGQGLSTVSMVAFLLREAVLAFFGYTIYLTVSPAGGMIFWTSTAT